MNKKFYSIIFLFSVYTSFPQSPEDALKLSWYHLGGTARNQAIGGAMGSLGGDASALMTTIAIARVGLRGHDQCVCSMFEQMHLRIVPFHYRRPP